MKINLEVISYDFFINEDSTSTLNTKALVKNMGIRRKMTRSSKLVVELLHNIQYNDQRVIYSTGFGELQTSSKILNALITNDFVSPTDFQNSVHNTPISYSSIIYKSHKEMLTISCGDTTSKKAFKVSAIKALDGDEIVLICCDVLDIDRIREVNNTVKYLEFAAAFKLKVSDLEKTIDADDYVRDKEYSKSIDFARFLIHNMKKENKNILSIEV